MINPDLVAKPTTTRLILIPSFLAVAYERIHGGTDNGTRRCCKNRLIRLTQVVTEINAVMAIVAAQA
jgi:hypothetical protein